MSLLDSEIARIKWHLGFNVLAIGAEPRIDHVAIFDQVIQPYVEAGAKTTSSTTVTAASEPTPVTLTLTSGTGFSSGDRVIIDVDARQERVTVQNISGASLTVLLTLAHTGTYPVAVEGPESIVRDVLARCDEAWTAYSESVDSAGLKGIGRGELEWYPEGSTGRVRSLRNILRAWRAELGSLLGIAPMNGGPSGRVEMY